MTIKSALPTIIASVLVLCSFSAKDSDRAEQPYRRIAPYPTGPDTVRIRVIGDVMMHSKQLEYPMGPFLEELAPDLKAADIAVANMEFTLAGKPYSGYPCFSAPDQYADYVADCGVNIFLTANNHILDKGSKGLGRTLEYYSSMEAGRDVRYVGCTLSGDDPASRNPLYVRAKGLKIAIVNFTYGTNRKDDVSSGHVNRIEEKEAICGAIRRAREQEADLVLVFPHWGKEYALTHNKTQEEVAGWVAQAGADMIIGAHPHVVQDKGRVSVAGEDGRIRDIPVYYSIGNAISNMSATNTQLELMVTVTAIREKDGSVRILEPSHEWLWCTLPGRLKGSYSTIKVEDWIGTRDSWKVRSEYDKMISAYNRVRKTTGLE